MMNVDSQKTIRYSHYQISDRVQCGGLLDNEQCKALARRVMQLYDTNGDGYVDSFEVGYMLTDCYKGINKGFTPTPTDIASYTRVLDKKGQGRVSLEEIEAQIIKYLGIQNVNSGTNSIGQSIIGQSHQLQSQQAQQQYRSESVGRVSSEKQSQYFQSNTQSQLSYQPPSRPEQSLGRIAQERLDVARRIFKKIDQNQIGYITEREVPELLKETYRQMGMNYEPTKDDVQVWMRMTDTDGDGRVTLEDYENLVLKSLKQQGITLN